MKKTLVFGFSLAAAMSASAAVTITAEISLAPNIFGSPSFDAWLGNATDAAEHGLTSSGAAGPAQFNVATSPLPAADNIVTGFNSWLGQAPGPFAGELGNRASLVGIINGGGSLISIDNLGFSMSGVGTAAFQASAQGVADGDGPFSFGPGTYTYDNRRIGIIFNNGTDISGGFSTITSGAASQQVNEIISIGSGNAPANFADPGNPGETDQQEIDYDLSQIGGYDFTGTFIYDGVNGSATEEFTAVPEPSTIIAGASMLLPFGASALRMLRKRQIA